MGEDQETESRFYRYSQAHYVSSRSEEDRSGTKSTLGEVA